MAPPWSTTATAKNVPRPTARSRDLSAKSHGVWSGCGSPALGHQITTAGCASESPWGTRAATWPATHDASPRTRWNGPTPCSRPERRNGWQRLREQAGAVGKLASCGMDHAEAVVLVERRRDAVRLREDVDAYLNLFADDFAFFVNGVERTRGRLALENAVRRSHLRFRPISWEFHEIAVHGDNVMTEWTVVMEERTTGGTRRFRAMSICEIHDGLATWQRETRSPFGG